MKTARLRSWLRRDKSTPGKAVRRRPPHFCQLSFEPLEDRRLLSVSLNLNGSQTITPGATINVTSLVTADAFNEQSEMQIVVNPTNPLNVVGFSHRIGGGTIAMDVYRSMDGGLTWTTTTRIDGTNADGLGDDTFGTTTFRFDPATTFDANGRLYIAYGVRGGAGPPATPTRLVAAVSTDGGGSFFNFRLLDTANDRNGAGTPPPGVDKWYLTSGVDPNSGNQAVYISYVNFGTEGIGTTLNDDRIMVAGTRDGGANWTIPMAINDPSITGANQGSSYASPVVGLNGELAISWHDSNSDTIFLDRDMDGLWATGANFGADITVRTGVTVDRTVNLPPAQPQRGVNAAPMLEVWRNLGTLFMPVVEQFSGNDLDLKVGKSTDFGATWTFTPLDSSTGTEFNPWLQVDPTSGVISVLYYTTDGDVATGNDDVRPRLATSFDAGATWTKTFLSNQTSNSAGGTTNDYLEYIGLAARDGTVHGLWSSNYPMGGTDLDALTANAGFVSSIGDNRLFIGESGGADDYFEIRQSAANPAFLEVFVDGVREFTGLSTTLDKIIFNPGAGVNTFNIGTLTGISSITINGTNNVDTFNLEALGSGTPLSMVLGGAGDFVNLAPNNPFAISAINAPVTIFGDAGADTLNVGSGGLHAVSGLVTYNAGAIEEGNALNLYDDANPFFVDYQITDSSVTRIDPFFFGGVNYSGVNNITLEATEGPNTITLTAASVNTTNIHGNGSNDTFVIGGGQVGFHPASVFDGGEGIDAITFDDRSTSSNSTWIVESGIVQFFGGVFGVSTQGFESVNCLAGTGNNTIRIVGDMSQNISVDGGDGGDAVILEAVSNYRDFFDQDGNPAFHYAMDLDGGGGFNSLTVDDTLDFDRSYAVWPDRVLINEGAPLGLDFDYDLFQSVTILSPPNPLQFTPEFHIFGTSSDIPVTHQMTIIGSSQTDQFVVHPHDAQGNPTINGNLGIGGGGGFDTLVVDDAGSSLPISYSFYNQFGPGTTNIGGLGAAGFGAGSDVENIVVNAGNGDDEFAIHSFQAASALSVNAGGGLDKVLVSPTAKNLTADVMGMSSFNYDGGNGFDYFLLYNDNSADLWTYTRTADFLRTQDISAGRFVVWNQQNVEYLDVTGGAQPDAFLIQSTPTTGQSYNTFRGAGGNDNYVVGNAGRTNLITANVAIVNDAGDDFATIDNSADTVGRTVHVDEYFVGGTVGDDLFGPGGYLYHVNLRGVMTVWLGGGADTAYVAPNVFTPITIFGFSPFAAPGDFLGLAFGNVVNPVFTPLTFGQNQYSFDNAAPVVYSAFEQVNIDAVNPFVVSQQYSEAGPLPAIVAQFSERVVSTPNPLQPYYLELMNTTTSQLIPYANVAMDYNQSNNVATFTFPGYPAGRLPAGMYTAKFLAGPTDNYGNRMENQNAFAFTATAPLEGDFDGSGVVDQGDYALWRGNFGMAVPPGTMGDGNGDGIVNSADYTLWRDNLGAMSPGSGGGSSLVNVGPGQDVLRASDGPRNAVEIAHAPMAIDHPALFAVFGPRAIDTPNGHLHARESRFAAARRDDGLLAWLASRTERGRGNLDDHVTSDTINDAADGWAETRYQAFDTALETILIGAV